MADESRRRKWTLGDLVVAVTAVAVALSLLRGMGGFIHDPTRSPLGALMTANPAGTGSVASPHRIFAAGMVLVGVGIVMGLAVSAWRRRGDWAGAAWRVGAIALIGTFLTATADVASGERLAAQQAGNIAERRLQAQVEIVPLCLALAACGVVVALGPARPRRSDRRAGRFRSLVPGSALLEGVMLYTLATGMLVLLNLIALEGVRNALHRPGEMTRAKALGGDFSASLAGRFGPESLARRSYETALEGAAVLAACVVCATWLGDSLRGFSKPPRGWFGTAFRVVSALACWAGGARLTLVSLPRLQQWYVDGFVDTAYPRIVSAVAVGFASLAFGLCAAAAASDLLSEAPPRPISASARRFRRFGVIALGALLIAVAISGAARFWPDASPLPAWITDGVLMMFGDPTLHLRTSANRAANIVAPLLGLDALALWGLLGWLTVRSAALLFADRSEPAALDRVLVHPRAFFVLIGRALAMAGAILALFPAVVATSIGLQRFLL